MSKHLSEQGVSMYLIGDATLEDRRHTAECPACRQKIATLAAALGNFRGAVRNWSEGARARSRAAELRWTVLPPSDHLERLLPPASLSTSWFRSLWNNLRDLVGPPLPPLDVSAKPLLVRNIWEQNGPQKKAWALSLALQSAAVVLLFTVASSTVTQKMVVERITLLTPLLAPYEPKLAHAPGQGGGGGGDRSPLPASNGQLPKAAPRQFTPPMAVIHNTEPKLIMEPTIVAPPEAHLPQVNVAQYGDPFSRVGPPSNGPGFGGGIGDGSGGGVGAGKGPGFGPGEGGGVGGGVFRVGGGVSAPVLVQKVEPEYSEEARKAKYQGTVILYVEVDPSGQARNIRVVRSLGLGLDEKAIQAVTRWRFRPGQIDGKPVTVAATIEVNFRLL